MQNIEYINAYFDKNLSPDEMRQFDQKIQDDPVFADEVAFYCSSLSALKDQMNEEKKKRFREIYNTEELLKENKPPVVFMRRWLKVAAVAAVILIILMAGWFWWPQPTPKEMADKYIKENFNELPVTMGNENSLQKGKNLYNDNKPAEALEQFETILKTDTGNTEAKKYAGIVSLKLKQYDKALEYFSDVEKTTLHTNPGKFYHALTLMKRGNPVDMLKAKQLLHEVLENDLAEKRTAEEWLGKW